MAIFFWAWETVDAVFSFKGEVVQPRKKVGATFAEAGGGTTDLSDALGPDAAKPRDNRSRQQPDDKNRDGKEHQDSERDGEDVPHDGWENKGKSWGREGETGLLTAKNAESTILGTSNNQHRITNIQWGKGKGDGKMTYF